MTLPSFVLLVLASLTMLFVLVGCGDSQQAANVNAASSLPAAIASANTITVTGTATVPNAPDEALITLTVETDGPSPAEALDANSREIRNVLDRLRAEGVEEDAVRTANVSVYPIRTYDPKSGKESLSGYRAQNSATVTLKDAAVVGRILAASIETGATSISGPVWRLSEDGPAVTEALRKAAANAEAKARALAESQGVRVGQVVLMSEGSVDLPIIPVYTDVAAEAAGRVAEPPVRPGTLDVTATVTISYALVR